MSELHYLLQQKRYQKCDKKKDGLDTIEIAISVALEECGNIKKEICATKPAKPSIDSAYYECLAHSMVSVECAIKKLREMQELISEE